MSTFEELIERRKKGSLKVYLGYAAGVGKTYAMLQEGHRLKSQGIDVVIGYLEPHGRKETFDQVKDLEILPTRGVEIGNRPYQEMDLNAVLRRKPQVALIDELAHTNLAGSKNEKRYQDVLEILDHQINVISTLNVQHLESVAEKIESVTKVSIRERIPDNLLQQADQIVNVDLTTEELRERLRLGKIYEKSLAEIAMLNFFTHRNLSVLREVALREAAGDQVRKIREQELVQGQEAALTQEAVMVALSSNPNNAEMLIRKGARLATQLSSKCYIVYVQKNSEAPTVIDSELQRRVQNNLKLAQTLGAEVIILKSNNVSEALVTFAQENNIYHAVFGKSRLSPLQERFRGSVLLDFLHDSVGIDVHILSTAPE
jgi:two-component system sensor histidine kinase KdpD